MRCGAKNPVCINAIELGTVCAIVLYILVVGIVGVVVATDLEYGICHSSVNIYKDNLR